MSTVNEQCSTCGLVEDMRVVGEDGDRREVECSLCGDSTYPPKGD